MRKHIGLWAMVDRALTYCGTEGVVELQAYGDRHGGLRFYVLRRGLHWRHVALFVTPARKRRRVLH